MKLDNSDSESESECPIFNVEESYKSNTRLKKITQNFQKNEDAKEILMNIKKKLGDGVKPMQINKRSSDLGNGFYYIRKSTIRIIVKVDSKTGNSDILGVALRSRQKNMRTLGKVINSQYDLKHKINTNSY